jgi:hypothetical protein
MVNLRKRYYAMSFGVVLVLLATVANFQKKAALLLPKMVPLALETMQAKLDSTLGSLNQSNGIGHVVGNVVLLLCNEKYCPAVASLVASLRKDGGYRDDVAVIMEESVNYTLASLKHDIIKEGGGNTPLVNVTFFTASELFESLQLDDDDKYLGETPPMSTSCIGDGGVEKRKRKKKHRAYYLKSLMFHQVFAERWKTVLYMDACMTIHSSHINEIFSLPEIEEHILASPDPWRWGRKMLAGKIDNSCPDPNTTQLLTHLVGKPLGEASYFASGVVLYDTAIVRDYGDSPKATLVELLKVYHQLSAILVGDQEILSVYWVYKRKKFAVMPLAMFGSDRVPYEFLTRVPYDPHIITAGNADRPVCALRSTNNLNSKIKRW